MKARGEGGGLAGSLDDGGSPAPNSHLLRGINSTWVNTGYLAAFLFFQATVLMEVAKFGRL